MIMYNHKITKDSPIVKSNVENFFCTSLPDIHPVPLLFLQVSNKELVAVHLKLIKVVNFHTTFPQNETLIYILLTFVQHV